MSNFLVILLQIEPPVPTVGSDAWSAGGGYGTLMALLLLLLGGMIAAFVVFKKFGLPKARKGGSLELLETRPLGGRQFIVVGKYGESRFLLGVCQGRIDYLCPLQEPTSSDQGFEEILDQASQED